MKELQYDILNLREEVQSQKQVFTKTAQENARTRQSLEDKNAVLEQRLKDSEENGIVANARSKELQEKLLSSRASIQSHVQQIESLRAEVCFTFLL